MTPALDIEFGDANLVDTNGTGWFVGFGDWLRSPGAALRHMPAEAAVRGLCMKWGIHRRGDTLGTGKPVSAGRTLSMLVSEHGRFRLQFSPDPAFPPGETVEHALSRHGQFCAWGAGIHHRWFVDEDCIILTLRWTPAS
ncbi:hypothetical protein SAMN06265795_10787 [Noviherbaspirillum humi]|uniref:Uncharacterized protein n=1 Tax=Noviherbaspirillum humi TaxID=1688639 RepID=A0A239HNR5_9BURK|nr:hypothetical protein [Noviherbaspirillum humi]SNS82942.1 hypothetical protein SAMN06265795_10787 [Noviherbaspirillum humi]